MDNMVQHFKNNLHRDGFTTGSYYTQGYNLFSDFSFRNLVSYYVQEITVKVLDYIQSALS